MYNFRAYGAGNELFGLTTNYAAYEKTSFLHFKIRSELELFCYVGLGTLNLILYGEKARHYVLVGTSDYEILPRLAVAVYINKKRVAPCIVARSDPHRNVVRDVQAPSLARPRAVPRIPGWCVV